jgi:hypothetical protein
VIFRGGQCSLVDLLAREAPPRLSQRRGPQQAADVFGAEGRALLIEHCPPGWLSPDSHFLGLRTFKPAVIRGTGH